MIIGAHFPLKGGNVALPSILNYFKVAHSPDEKFIAGTDGKGKIEIWDTQTLELISSWESKDAVTPIIAFHPNGKYLITALESDLHLWDFQNGKKAIKLEGHYSNITALSFSPDGNWMGSCDDIGESLIWDLNQNYIILSRCSLNEDFGRSISACGFSSDGKYFFTGRKDGFIDQWNWKNEALFYRFGKEGKSVSAISLQKDGMLLAAGISGKGVQVYDIISGNLVFALLDNEATINNLAFKPSSNKLYVAYNLPVGLKEELSTGVLSSGFLSCWDIVKQKEVWQKHFENGLFDFEIFAEHPALFTFGNLNRLQDIDLETGATRKSAPFSKNAVNCMEIHPENGWTIIGDASNILKIIDPNSGNLIGYKELKADRPVTAIKLDPTLKFLAVAQGALVQIIETNAAFTKWDPLYQMEVADGEIVKIHHGRNPGELMLVIENKVHSLQLFSKGNDYSKEDSSPNSAKVEIWDLNKKELLLNYAEYSGPGYEVEYNDLNNFMVCADKYHQIELIDWKNHSLLGRFPLHRAVITSGNFSQDKSYYISSSADPLVWLWDLYQLQVREIGHFNEPVLDVTMDFSNSVIATASPSRIQFWSVPAGEPLMGDIPVERPVSETKFSKDGNLLIGIDADKNLNFWNIQAGQLVNKISFFGEKDLVSWNVNGGFSGTEDGLKLNELHPDQALTVFEHEALESAFETAAPDTLVTQPELMGWSEEEVTVDSVVVLEQVIKKGLAFAENEAELPVDNLLFKGDFVAAENMATKMLYENADDLGIRAVLAVAYLYTGKFDKAKILWSRYRTTILETGVNFEETLKNYIDELALNGYSHQNTSRFLSLLIP